MSPIIFHQVKEYSQDIHFNVPLYWMFHHTPHGYIDGYGWIKSMTQFSTVCGASTINDKIIFFDGCDIHSNDCALSYM